MIDQTKYLNLAQSVFSTGYLQKVAAVAALADAIDQESDPIDKAVAATKKVTDLFFQCLGEINV